MNALFHENNSEGRTAGGHIGHVSATGQSHVVKLHSSYYPKTPAIHGLQETKYYYLVGKLFYLDGKLGTAHTNSSGRSLNLHCLRLEFGNNS